MIWGAITGAARLVLETGSCQAYVTAVRREVQEMILAYVRPMLWNGCIP